MSARIKQQVKTGAATLRAGLERAFAPKHVHISTREGLFEWTKRERGWRFGPVRFLREPVSIALPDSRAGSLHAALNLG